MTARVAILQVRFEILALTAAVLALLGATIVAGLGILQAMPDAACLQHYLRTEELQAGCPSLAPWFEANRQVSALRGLIGYLPLAVAVVLGSVVLSREFESRAAQFPWVLQGRRAGWAFGHVTPIMVVALGLAAITAVSAEWLASVVAPTVDPAQSLADYRDRGPAPVLIAFAVFSIAVLAGALVGRQLPALLISTAVALGVLWAANAAFPWGVAPRWIPSSDWQALTYHQRNASRQVGSGTALDDGRIISNDEFAAMAPPGLTEEERDAWLGDHRRPMTQVLMGDQRWEITIRESLVMTGLGAASLVATAILVRRREWVA